MPGGTPARFGCSSALAAVDRTSQPPGMHTKLIKTDHPKSVHAKHIAQNAINCACDALAAWF